MREADTLVRQSVSGPTMADISLHTIAGCGFLIGLLFLTTCALLWRGLNDGFLASFTLPIFLGVSVLLTVISAGIWLVTR